MLYARGKDTTSATRLHPVRHEPRREIFAAAYLYLFDSGAAELDTPYAHFELERTFSTQDEAMRLLADNERVVVSTGHQTSGRGRRGSKWLSAPRALAVSVGFRPEWPSEAWPRITLLAGLAARGVLGDHLSLKWPNDLLIDDSKVGGLLAEAVDDRLVVGLGVNLYWTDPPDGVGAVYPEDPGSAAVGRLAATFAAELFDRLVCGPEQWGRDEYRAACSTIGRRIRWEPSGDGIVVDVGLDGTLLVERHGVPTSIMSGEVWEVRDAP